MKTKKTILALIILISIISLSCEKSPSRERGAERLDASASLVGTSHTPRVLIGTLSVNRVPVPIYKSEQFSTTFMWENSGKFSVFDSGNYYKFSNLPAGTPVTVFYVPVYELQQDGQKKEVYIEILEIVIR